MGHETKNIIDLFQAIFNDATLAYAKYMLNFFTECLNQRLFLASPVTQSKVLSGLGKKALLVIETPFKSPNGGVLLSNIAI